jgi:hypothetical protein
MKSNVSLEWKLKCKWVQRNNNLVTNKIKNEKSRKKKVK